MSLKVSVEIVIFSTVFGLIAAQGKPPVDPGLIQNVEPNFDVVKGLICYQCRSVTSEIQPLCDKSMFRLSTPQEKYNMSLQCPHYQGAYCFTKVISKKGGKYVETIRGCSGPKDKNGNPMKVGCMKKKHEQICLCDKKFCNGDTHFGNTPKIIVIVLGVLVLLNY